MKKFSELRIGDEFFVETKIGLVDLENYLNFSGILNVLYQNAEDSKKFVSGRAILGRMEGEFTKLKEMYGNLLILYGMDGDPSWKNRQTRFLKPLFVNEILKVKFKISEKTDLNNDFGLLSIDFEGKNENGELVVVSKGNIYRIKKEPKMNP